ncbi:hypothetical protein V8C35DRAFT_294867 [Trichoderma chlorosporum]
MNVGSRPSQRFKGPAEFPEKFVSNTLCRWPIVWQDRRLALPNSRCGATGSCKRWSWRRSIRPIATTLQRASGTAAMNPTRTSSLSSFMQGPNWGERERRAGPRCGNHGRAELQARMAEITSDAKAAKHSPTYSFSVDCLRQSSEMHINCLSPRTTWARYAVLLTRNGLDTFLKGHSFTAAIQPQPVNSSNVAFHVA